MIQNKMFALLLATVATGFSLSALADESGPRNGSCALSGLHVTSVTPLVREVNNGKRTVSRDIVGAELRVPAERGVTREWIAAEIDRHLASMRGTPMASCPLGVADSRVEVRSEDAGYVVRIQGKDPATGQEILRRAQGL